MATWTEPLYSKVEINAAGRVLVKSAREDWEGWTKDDWENYYSAIQVINNWRSSHAYPLNTFQVNLRNACRRVDRNPLIAQRIKRLSSIRHKLDRFDTMKLSQMQDLGGCRAVLSRSAKVKAVCQHYLRESAAKHRLATVDDYLEQPKKSGYRGIHLVYRYFSDKNKAMYNDLKIEMQLRSREQHAWATAVETAGMFSGQALKSSMGSEEWQRFFSLMGSAIALRERSPLVPGTPTNQKELLEELQYLAEWLNVEARLREYGNALQKLSKAKEGAHYYLLELDPRKGTLLVSGFGKSQVEEAENAYAEAERLAKDRADTDAVLVSVESINALGRAYPNYFADTRLFLELVEQAITGHRKRIRVDDINLDLFE